MGKTIGRHAVYNLLGSALPLALSLVTVPFYLKLIGTDRYSVLAIAWLFLGYFGLFDLGLGRSTAYRIAAQKHDAPVERAITFWTAALINPIIGIVTGGILWAVSGWYFSSVFKVDDALRPEIMAGVPLLALSVPIATLTGTLTGTLQGREKFLTINVISVTSTTLFQILPLTVAYLYKPYLPLLLAAAIGARLLAVICLWWECHNEVTIGFPPQFSAERFRDLIGYGGWIAVSSLLAPLLTALDRFVIGGGLGATAVTNYTVPMQVIQRIAIFPNALMSALFPKITIASPDDRRHYSKQAERLVSSVLLMPMVTAAAFSSHLLTFWLGAKMGPSMAPVATVLLCSFWFNAISIVYVVQLQALGRPRVITLIYLFQTPIYILALFVLMNRFGLVGCAFALALRSFVDLLMQLYLLERRLPSISLLIQIAIMWLAVLATLADLGDIYLLVLIALASVVSLTFAPWDLVMKLRESLISSNGKNE